MPGSTIKAVLNEPYLTSWIAGVLSNNVGSFTVVSHPFTTGDVIYVKLFINGFLQTTQPKYFVIVDSPTQLRYASSFANAIAGVALSIPQGLTVNQSGLGNTPTIGASHPQYPMLYNPSTWMASSRSVVSFSPTSNVHIDFTISTYAERAAVIHTQNLGTSNSYVCGLSAIGGIFQQSGTLTASPNPININYLPGSTTFPISGRFTLQNSRISLSVKQINQSYLTVFTSNIIPGSTDPLFFSACFGLNDQDFNNCTITYF
jgi:hypothetical protein